MKANRRLKSDSPQALAEIHVALGPGDGSDVAPQDVFAPQRLEDLAIDLSDCSGTLLDAVQLLEGRAHRGNIVAQSPTLVVMPPLEVPQGGKPAAEEDK